MRLALGIRLRIPWRRGGRRILQAWTVRGGRGCAGTLRLALSLLTTAALSDHSGTVSSDLSEPCDRVAVVPPSWDHLVVTSFCDKVHVVWWRLHRKRGTRQVV